MGLTVDVDSYPRHVKGLRSLTGVMLAASARCRVFEDPGGLGWLHDIFVDLPLSFVQTITCCSTLLLWEVPSGTDSHTEENPGIYLSRAHSKAPRISPQLTGTVEKRVPTFHVHSPSKFSNKVKLYQILLEELGIFIF